MVGESALRVLALPGNSASGTALAGGWTGQPTEETIRRLVNRFYALVRCDAVLGPVFSQALGEDAEAWEAHLARLSDFWSSLMLTSGRYHGDPFSAHLRLPGLEPAMFDRWLALFGGACAELSEPNLAATFRERANRVARSLRMGLFERLPVARRGHA